MTWIVSMARPRAQTADVTCWGLDTEFSCFCSTPCPHRDMCSGLYPSLSLEPPAWLRASWVYYCQKPLTAHCWRHFLTFRRIHIGDWGRKRCPYRPWIPHRYGVVFLIIHKYHLGGWQFGGAGGENVLVTFNRTKQSCWKTKVWG